MQFTKSTLLAAAIAVAMTSYSFHSDAQSLDSENNQLEEMVVTADRSSRSVDDTLATVSIIDRELIERSQAQDLLEILRLQAGVDIVRSGGPGGQTSVFLRGTNSNHVLVLIDGVRVSSANSGLFQFENLPVQQIERIEIVRGPRAGYYGSDALGGVIQIFTRRGEGMQIRAGYGSGDNFQASASDGWRGDKGGVTGTLSWRNNNGFSSQNENGFAFNPDDDGYRNLAFSLVGDYQLGPGQLDFTAYGTDTETEFDQGETDGVDQAFRIAYQLQTGRWNNQLSLNYNRNDLESQFTGDFPFTTDFNSERYQVSWVNEFALTEHLQLLSGLDAYEEFGEDEGSFNDDRTNIGGFVGMLYREDRHSVDLTLRMDDDENYEKEPSGQFAYGYQLTPRLQVIGSYAHGFKSPTFNQLYSPGFGGAFAGNPELEPEVSDAFELNFRYQWGQHRLALNGFYQDIDDLIQFAGENFQAVNVQNAEVLGIELDYQWSNKRWSVTANATLQDAEDQSSGNELLRRPDEKASITLDYHFGNGGWVGTELFYAGPSSDIGGVKLDDYFLLNFRAGYPIWKKLRIEGRLENATDENYQRAFGFNTQDIAGFINLSWSE